MSNKSISAKKLVEQYLEHQHLTIRQLKDAIVADGIDITFEAVNGAAENLLLDHVIEVVGVKPSRERVLGLFGSAPVVAVHAPVRHISMPLQRASDAIAWIVATSGADAAASA